MSRRPRRKAGRLAPRRGFAGACGSAGSTSCSRRRSVGRLWWFFDRINGVLKYQWDWSVIARFLVKVDAKTGAIVPNVLLEGLFTTLRLAFWGLLLATLIGLAMGAARTSRRLFPRLIAGAYVMLVRNVPPLVFVFIVVFFVASQVLAPLGDRGRDRAPRARTPKPGSRSCSGPTKLIENFLSGLVCIALFSGAYVTEIVRAGIESVPRSQREAGESLALTRTDIMRFIVMPQARAQGAAAARRPVYPDGQGLVAGFAGLRPGTLVRGDGHPGFDPESLRSADLYRGALFRDLLWPVAALRTARALCRSRADLAYGRPRTPTGLDRSRSARQADRLSRAVLVRRRTCLWRDPRSNRRPVREDDGPTALVTAGVHGDEYEGLLIARSVSSGISSLPTSPDGVIVMPAVNLPAVRARTRTSPIDRQNMNRAFPGDAGTGPTAMIASFIERRLLPDIDVALDLHSGGTQSIYAPCGYVYEMGDAAFRSRKLAACHAFGAPLTATVAATSSGGSLSAACERAAFPCWRLNSAAAQGWTGRLSRSAGAAR